MTKIENLSRSALRGLAFWGFRILLSIDVLIALGVLFRFALGGSTGVVQAISHAMLIEDPEQVPAALGDFTAIVCGLLLLTVAGFFLTRQGSSKKAFLDGQESLVRA